MLRKANTVLSWYLGTFQSPADPAVPSNSSRDATPLKHLPSIMLQRQRALLAAALMRHIEGTWLRHHSSRGHRHRLCCHDFVCAARLRMEAIATYGFQGGRFFLSSLPIPSADCAKNVAVQAGTTVSTLVLRRWLRGKYWVVVTQPPFGIWAQNSLHIIVTTRRLKWILSVGMGESFLLSKDEPLTPDIDGVMALWIFRRRAQNTQNLQTWKRVDRREA